MATRAELARELGADLLVVIGSGLTAYGSYLIYEPMGFIVSGIVLVGLGVLVAK